MKQQKRQLLRIRADRLAALSRVGTVLMGHVDEAAVLRFCAQAARDLTGAAFAAVIVRPVSEEQEEGEPLVPREATRFQLSVIVGATQEQEAFLGRVLLTGEELLAPLLQERPMRVADIVPLFSSAEVPPPAAGQDLAAQAAGAWAQGSVEKEEHAEGLPLGQAVVRSLLGAPLLDHAGQVRGGVLLGHCESGHFRQEDEILLVNLATQTALALERARLFRLAEPRDQQWPAVLDKSADAASLLDTYGSLVHDNGAARQVQERLQDMPKGGEQAVAARLQEAEPEARQPAEQLETIFEAVPEALLVYDREGRLTQMNTAGQQLYERLGLSESTAAPFANRAAQVTVWDDYGQPLAKESFPNARILAGEVLTPAQPMEIMLRDRQGERVCLSITGGPLHNTQGHLVGAVTICHDITEHNRTERTLRQQAQQLQLQAELIDRAHDAILVRDPDSRILSWNRGAQHLYGWTAQEVLGQVTHELLQTSFPVSLADVAAHLEREGQWEGELRHRCRNGTEVLVESRHVLVRDAGGRPTAILEINRDISQRRWLEALQWQLQAARQAQLGLLQLVLDELPSSVCLVCGPDARLVLANRATDTLWGANWTRHQPLSAFLQEHGIRVLRPDGKVLPPEQWATWHALREGQAVSQYQEIIARPDGQTLPMLVNAVPLTLSPLLLGPEESSSPAALVPEPAALMVYQDVTALKEAERLKDEFLGIAAHELRTPLAVLSSAAQTLRLQQQLGRGVPLEEWQREALAIIEEATQQLVTLSEALLDITRLQGGRLQVSPEPVDLVALSRRVVKRLQRTTQRHHLSLHTSQDQLIIALDAGRIEQVLTNLLSNAIKYSPQGGPIEVTIWVEPSVYFAVLSVRDEGIGIPAQQQATIFGRFVRATNARTIAGSGLGLSLCRSLVELHGGRLWFESIEGRGSTFFMALPTDREGVAPG